MSLGNGFPVRSNLPDTFKVQGVWTGGSTTADCTHDSADYSRGISGIAYNAATGKYKITFIDVGQQIVGHNIRVCCATGTGEKQVNLVRSTFSTSAKTVEIEVFDLGATPALVVLATTDKILVDVTFAKNGP